MAVIITAVHLKTWERHIAPRLSTIRSQENRLVPFYFLTHILCAKHVFNNLNCIRTIFDCSAPLSPSLPSSHLRYIFITELKPFSHWSLYRTIPSTWLSWLSCCSKFTSCLQTFSCGLHLTYCTLFFYALSTVDKGEPSYPWIPYYASLTPPVQKRHPVPFCPSSQEPLSSYGHRSFRNKSSGISGLDALVTGRMLQYRFDCCCWINLFFNSKAKIKTCLPPASTSSWLHTPAWRPVWGGTSDVLG